MDELDLFRDFRDGVAAPSEDARQQASARLASAVAREQKPRTGVLRRIGRRPRYGALALAALAGAAVAALFFSTPWKGSPGFLERAQAALTPDAGTILHYTWETTSTFTDPACTLTRGPSEIWIDQTPPQRYRVILHDLPPDPNLCSSGEAWEFAGTFDTQGIVRFVPPNTLVRFVAPNTLSASPSVRFVLPTDPVTELREAIGTGSAHDEGETQLDGRTVERIRIDPPSACPDCRPSYVYVDPETYYPVQVDNQMVLIEGPDRPAVRFRTVSRILTFEYLPRTAANLALTDIKAQHPKATGP